MREFAPEIVFHLAAQPLVRRSYVDPVGTYATNVLGTAHLLESVRTLPSVRAVVVVTTDKCYLQIGNGRGDIEKRIRWGDTILTAAARRAQKFCVLPIVVRSSRRKTRSIKCCSPQQERGM